MPPSAATGRVTKYVEEEYEASAALVAARLGVDEIVFIAARLRGASAQDIHKRWKAKDVLTTGFDTRPDFNIDEVNALRARRSWYDETNDYRNVLCTGDGGRK